jgi:hypothetical protein
VRLEDKYGLIDKAGTEIVPVVCDYIGNYDDNTLLNVDNSCTIQQNGKYGLVSTQGIILAEMIYNSEEEAASAAFEQGWRGSILADEFREMDAAVVEKIHSIEKVEKGIHRFRNEEYWGLITEKGAFLLKATYEAIDALENDCFPFKQDGKWGLLNLQGKVVLPAIYDTARGFSNGQAACEINGLWGAVNFSGQWMFQPKFTELGEYKEGMSAAQQDGLYGFVDEYGEKCIDFQYPYVLDFNHGVCAVLDLEQEEVYFIDDKGTVVSERYTRLFGPNDDLWMHVVKDNQWGILQANRSFVVPIKYDLPKAMGQVLQTIENDRIPIKKGPLMGFANRSGTEVVPPKYVTVDPFCEGLSLVTTLDPTLNKEATPSSIEATGSISGVFDYGFIDAEGNEVVPRKYILAHRFKHGLAFVKNKNFQMGYITYDGTEYFKD